MKQRPVWIWKEPQWRNPQVAKKLPLVFPTAFFTSIFHPITEREQVTAASVYLPKEAAVDGWPQGQAASLFHTPRNMRNKMYTESRSLWSIQASRSTLRTISPHLLNSTTLTWFRKCRQREMSLSQPGFFSSPGPTTFSLARSSEVFSRRRRTVKAVCRLPFDSHGDNFPRGRFEEETTATERKIDV